MGQMSTFYRDVYGHRATRTGRNSIPPRTPGSGSSIDSGARVSETTITVSLALLAVGLFVAWRLLRR